LSVPPRRQGCRDTARTPPLPPPPCKRERLSYICRLDCLICALTVLYVPNNLTVLYVPNLTVLYVPNLTVLDPEPQHQQQQQQQQQQEEKEEEEEKEDTLRHGRGHRGGIARGARRQCRAHRSLFDCLICEKENLDCRVCETETDFC